MSHQFRPRQIPVRAIRLAVIVVIVIVVFVPLSLRLFKSVDAGHVGVATLFGKIQAESFEPGLHFPVNPFYKWHEYDARQKTHMEQAGVPSQDQLTTNVDVSVQYRVNGAMAGAILGDTGTAAQAVEVHLIPELRSAIREAGKAIKRAEDFFLEETQQQLQDLLQIRLRESLEPKGLEIQDVLIREITLPSRLIAQIEQKKEAEQLAEREKANLLKFRTEQEQLVVAAEAARKAAEEEALQIKVLADAQAYEIEKINAAIAENPAYIQLQAIEALKAISNDKAAKLYFLNGDAPMPLPLMNLGEPLQK
ncbi:MAG: SPFH domain-containing protein [Planctomycetota bacterium]|jgi:regulator of protease activity HflC (stomatin/prohibitin superfamily)